MTVANTQTTFSNVTLGCSDYSTGEESYEGFTKEWQDYIAKIDKAFESGNEEEAKEIAEEFVEYLEEEGVEHQLIFQYLTEYPRCSLDTYELLRDHLDVLGGVSEYGL